MFIFHLNIISNTPLNFFLFPPSFLIQQGKMQLNIIRCIPSPFLNGFFGNYSSSYSAPAMADLTGEQSPSRATLTQDPVSVTGKKHTHHLYQRKELNVLFTPPPCTVSKIAQSFLFFPVPVTYYYTLFLRKSIFYYCH